MKKTLPFLVALTLAMPISGCVSKVITAPFRAAGTVVETGVDAATQTQSEKEEDRGRRSLEAEKKLNTLYEERKQVAKQCRSDPDGRACDRLDAIDDEIDEVRKAL